MIQKYQLYMDGQRVAPAQGRMFPSTNPYTGEVWAEIPEAGPEDVAKAVAAAKQAFEREWRHTPGVKRALAVVCGFFVFQQITGINVPLYYGPTLLGDYFKTGNGKVDATIMWFTDIFMSVPNLLLVIVINTSMKPPIGRWMDSMYMATGNMLFRNTVIVDFIMVFGTIALVMWPPYARTVRAQVLTVRSQPYVLAARSLGLTSSQIILRYLIPNSIGPLIVAVSAGLGGAMVLESAFSFLGVGVQPPTPSWGLMISDGLRTWQQYPHLLAAPAIALAIASVAFSFIGDGLNDALNPKGAK